MGGRVMVGFIVRSVGRTRSGSGVCDEGKVGWEVGWEVFVVVEEAVPNRDVRERDMVVAVVGWRICLC